MKGAWKPSLKCPAVTFPIQCTGQVGVNTSLLNIIICSLLAVRSGCPHAWSPLAVQEPGPNPTPGCGAHSDESWPLSAPLRLCCLRPHLNFFSSRGHTCAQPFATVTCLSRNPGRRKMMSILPVRKLRSRKVHTNDEKRSPTQTQVTSGAGTGGGTEGLWRRGSCWLLPIPDDRLSLSPQTHTLRGDPLPGSSSSSLSLYLFLHHRQPHDSFTSLDSPFFLTPGILLLSLFFSS